MAIFAVTYRIDYDSEARYSRCYTDLTNAIQAQTAKYWAEPTSFYLIESSQNSKSIADAIVAATPDFDEEIDLLLVVNISLTKGHATRGKVRDTDFSVLMGRRST